MKTTFLKTIFIVAATAGVLTSCVNDDDYSVPALECNEPNITATKTVEEILAQATSTATEYTAADTIEARVVSSDRGGNFYKQLYLNSLDGEIGFVVQVNEVDMFTDYGVGRKVYISLKGLYVQVRSNTLQIGALYNGNVGQIPAELYRNHIFRSCDVVSEEELVNEVQLSDIDDSYIGKLVELQDVQFTDESLGQTYYNPTNVDAGGQTLTYITNSEEETITLPFRTGSFAQYAGTPVSPNNGKIRGILTKFNTTYQFVSRYESDIRLTEERIGDAPVDPGTPFYTEDFEDAEDNTNFNFPGWVNVAESGNWVWSEQVFPLTGNGNGYAEFSSYNSGSPLNVAWLVSPAIDMDVHTGETLNFDTAQHHLDVDSDGNKLEVYIFTSFDGTDIAGATKVDITDMVALPTSATDWYEFVNSGIIDLSSYTGNIYIAFKFTGSGTDTTLDGAFQIDNLVVSHND